MRKFNWSAQKARAHCIQRRSIVMPNDGFWRSLCAFEGQLGIQTRSDPNAVSGFSGADTPVKLAEGAAGDKVTVTFVPMQKLQALEAARQAARKLSSENKGARKRQEDKADENVRDKKRQRQEEENGRKDGKRPASETENGRHRDTDRRRHADSDKRRERSIDGDRDRGYGRDRGRDKDRRHRSRSREEGRRRHRSRSRDRDQNPRRDRDLDSRQAIEERQEFSTEELQEAPVVLETIKEGKAIGRLEINMKSSLQRCVFGRLPSNEVVLEHLSISRQHAQLTLDAAGDLFITDLGSAHQTNVDGVWIRPNQPRPLPIGSVFKLGGSSREYKVVMTPRQQTKDEMQRKREADLEEALANAGPSV